MTTQVEYALMAGGSYLSNRALVNQFPVPAGWTPTQHSTKASGFEAVSFYNGTSIANSTQIVISYAGTNPSSIADWVANVRLWAGFDALQLQQAADYYLQVQALNPNATISFTGHSLGGGLASLMAVMFDKTAVTFDQAPFRNAASASVASDLLSYLQGEGIYTAAQLAPLKTFIQEANAAPGTVPNESQVTDTNVQGEALSLAGSLNGRIGSLAQPDLTQQNDIWLPAVDLHSQALLTAFLQSDATSPAGQDHVTVALVDASNSSSPSTVNLTASMTDANETVSSNALSVTFASSNLDAPMAIGSGAVRCAGITCWAANDGCVAFEARAAWHAARQVA